MSWDDFTAILPAFQSELTVNKKWRNAVQKIKKKIIVLDDDPTGIQTVHSLPVYTSWNISTLKQILKDKHKVVYLLTNSRALTSDETQKLHQQLIEDLKYTARKENRDFLIISRSDLLLEDTTR